MARAWGRLRSVSVDHCCGGHSARRSGVANGTRRNSCFRNQSAVGTGRPSTPEPMCADATQHAEQGKEANPTHGRGRCAGRYPARAGALEIYISGGAIGWRRDAPESTSLLVIAPDSADITNGGRDAGTGNAQGVQDLGAVSIASVRAGIGARRIVVHHPRPSPGTDGVAGLPLISEKPATSAHLDPTGQARLRSGRTGESQYCGNRQHHHESAHVQPPQSERAIITPPTGRATIRHPGRSVGFEGTSERRS